VLNPGSCVGGLGNLCNADSDCAGSAYPLECWFGSCCKMDGDYCSSNSECCAGDCSGNSCSGEPTLCDDSGYVVLPGEDCPDLCDDGDYYFDDCPDECNDGSYSFDCPDPCTSPDD